MFNEEIIKNIEKLAEKGNVDEIIAILKNYKPDVANLGDALRGASRLGYKNIVDALLGYSKDFDPMRIGEAVNEAARYGYKDIVDMLLTHDSSSYVLGYAVSGAAISGQKDMIKTFLDSKVSITLEGIEYALKNASEHGHKDIVDMLLKYDKVTIPVDKLGDALKNAAEYGYIDIVKMLLNDNRVTIPVDKLGDALKNAAEHGHGDIVDMLLNDNRVTIPADKLGDALVNAVCSRHENIVDMLLKYDKATIPVDKLGDALKSAAKNGHRNIVDMLLNYNRATIPADKLGDALVNAVCSRHEDIADKLLKYDRATIDADIVGKILVGKMNDHIYSMEAKARFELEKKSGKECLSWRQGGSWAESYAGRYKDEVNTFLHYDKFTITADKLGDIFIKSVQHGVINKDIVYTILNYRVTICANKLGDALEEAARYGQKDIVNIILDYKKATITPDKLGDALISAEWHKHKDIIEAILNYNRGTISVDKFCDALIKAAEYEHKDIIEAILNYSRVTIAADKLGDVLKKADTVLAGKGEDTDKAIFLIKIEDLKKTFELIEKLANIAEKLNKEGSINSLGKINYALIRLIPIIATPQYFLHAMEQKDNVDKLEKGFNELKKEVSLGISDIHKFLKSDYKTSRSLIERSFKNEYEKIYEKRYQSDWKIFKPFHKIYNRILDYFSGQESKIITEAFTKMYFDCNNNNVSTTRITNTLQISNSTGIKMPPPTPRVPVPNTLVAPNSTISVPSLERNKD